MDYRDLNAVIVKNRYPIPLILETLDRLPKTKYFTKLDVISAFNRIRIDKDDEWKTAFLRTRHALFESLVMPFGLTEAPSTFQNYINSTLQEYLEFFCAAYLDDVLVYSNSKVQHRRVYLVLDKLKMAGLQLDINKCKFDASEVKYLGLIISRKVVEMDPLKIDCVKSWKTPSCVKDIQSLGFSNFYR
ncbi:hypothetical protein K3495_g9139 [Podosphaera aphanis]|nr:hypothetical protein K3495_g9139 [Podosphaera aphanis]